MEVGRINMYYLYNCAVRLNNPHCAATHKHMFINNSKHCWQPGTAKHVNTHFIKPYHSDMVEMLQSEFLETIQ